MTPAHPDREPQVRLNVRPYVITMGRTDSDAEVLLDDMVRIANFDTQPSAGRHREHRHILHLAKEPVAVSALTARLNMAPHVVKVLVGDLVHDGLLTIVASADDEQSGPSTAVLEQVLDGLRQL